MLVCYLNSSSDSHCAQMYMDMTNWIYEDIVTINQINVKKNITKVTATNTVRQKHTFVRNSHISLLFLQNLKVKTSSLIVFHQNITNKGF
jgi:hypothetical protein